MWIFPFVCAIIASNEFTNAHAQNDGAHKTAPDDLKDTKYELNPLKDYRSHKQKRGRTWFGFCGVDFNSYANALIDPKATENDTKWEYTYLTWALLGSHTCSSMDIGTTRQLLHKAFDYWTAGINLHIVETTDEKNADIKISFHKKNHNDQFPFDGKGRILGHAYFPPVGVVHFDDDENWLDELGDNDEGVNFFQVAVHEIGHALGLKHSIDDSSVMHFSNNKLTVEQMGENEAMERMLHQYGPKTLNTHELLLSDGKNRKEKPVTIAKELLPCPYKVHAATTAVNGITYLFVAYDVAIVNNSKIESWHPFREIFPFDFDRYYITAAFSVGHRTILFQSRKGYVFRWLTRKQKFKMIGKFEIPQKVSKGAQSAIELYSSLTLISNGIDFYYLNLLKNNNWNIYKLPQNFTLISDFKTHDGFKWGKNIAVIKGSKMLIYHASSQKFAYEVSVPKILMCDGSVFASDTNVNTNEVISLKVELPMLIDAATTG